MNSDAFGNSVGKNRYTYLRLTGQYGVSGLSIVIHSPLDGNGNSDRIACGSINLATVSSDSSGHGHPVEMKKKGLGPGSITMIIISIFFTIGLIYWYFFLMHKDKGHSKLSKSEEDIIVNQESTLNVLKNLLFLTLYYFFNTTHNAIIQPILFEHSKEEEHFENEAESPVKLFEEINDEI